MIRILFTVLAVVAAVLAIVLERPILFAAAAAMLLIVVIVWVTVARRRHRAAVKSFKPVTTAPTAPEEPLHALGIMEIRPKEPSRPPEPEATPAEETMAEALDEPQEALPVETVNEPQEAPPVETVNEPAEPVEAVADPAPPEPDLKEFVIEPTASSPRAGAHTNGRRAASNADTEAVLGPFLQALRAALGAQTACVLKQEDLAFAYQVIAHAGEDGLMPSGETFSATVPLLTARMARQPVTVRRIDADDLPRKSLGYSPAPEAVRRVAIAPAPRPDTDPDAYFLLADTPRTDLLNQPQAHTLLSQFARLLGLLLDTTAPHPASPMPQDVIPKPEAIPTLEAPPRPRREIIAEEMEQARAAGQALALAIVYLNRAEDIAETGAEAVADAEHLLATRLGQAAPTSRVVRFGELTYGVFYDSDLPEVEAWGVQIQAVLARETGLLDGGVSIGIALLQDRHQTPDAFRADATEALREAYETGTCTILE